METMAKAFWADSLEELAEELNSQIGDRMSDRSKHCASKLISVVPMVDNHSNPHLTKFGVIAIFEVN